MTTLPKSKSTDRPDNLNVFKAPYTLVQAFGFFKLYDDSMDFLKCSYRGHGHAATKLNPFRRSGRPGLTSDLAADFWWPSRIMAMQSPPCSLMRQASPARGRPWLYEAEAPTTYTQLTLLEKRFYWALHNS